MLHEVKCTPQGDESPQGGSTLQGDLVPHKVDRVYTRWTVLHKVEGAELEDSTYGPCLHKVTTPQGGLYPTRWTVSTQGGPCLHKVDRSPQG